MVDNKSTSMYFLLIQNDVKLQRLTRQCSRPQTRYVSGWVKVMFAAADRQLVTGIIANIPGIIFFDNGGYDKNTCNRWINSKIRNCFYFYLDRCDVVKNVEIEYEEKYEI
jgi:hypothetical protein